MSNFLEYVRRRDTKAWLEEMVRHAELVVEMAVKGDYAKTPILFDWDDIRYLYQFPPMFWKAALTLRYNKLLLEAKKAQEEGKKYPDRQKLTFRKGKGVFTFDVDTKINDLLEKLEKDKDLDALSNLGPHEEDKAKYQAGHYGYDIGEPKFHPKDEDQNFSRGYKAMAKQTAGRALQDWKSSVRSGWLGKVDHLPKMQVSFGGGKKQKTGEVKSMPILTGDILSKFVPQNRINQDHEVMWSYEDEKGNPKIYQSHLPLLLPGKMIASKDINKHEELMKQAAEAQKQGNMEHANELKAAAKEVQANAAKYNPYQWNVHRYNTETDPENPKKKKYRRLHTDVKRFGGFHPNAQQAEQLAGGSDVWDAIEPYVIDARGSNRVAAFDEDGNESYTKHSPIEKGVARFLKSISDSYEYFILNTMFDDLTQSSLLELREQLREPVIKKFVKALEDGDQENLGKAYKAMARNIENKAFNFAARVAQLNWGRGTRRLRKPAVEGIVSLQSAISKGEGEGKSVLDLARKYVDRLSTLGIEDAKGIGQRKHRLAGGLYGAEEIYFGHNIKNLEQIFGDLLNQRQSNIDSKNVKGELENDKEIRKEIFEQLWSLYIATQIKLGKPWTIADANKFADAKLKEVIAKRGMKVSSAPADLVASLGTAKLASKEASRLAQQEQDKAEILAAVGRESEVSKSDVAEKQIFDPKTIEFLKKNPAALQNAEKVAEDESDPDKRNQMRAIIDRVKEEMGMKIAAKKQAPATTVNAPVSNPNITVYTPRLAQRLAQDPQSLERIRNNPTMMANPTWQQAVATADQIIKGGND